MTRIYSPWDQPLLGANLAVDDTGYILSVSSTCNAHRMARSTIAVTDQSAVELQLYSPDGSAPSLVSSGGVPPLAVGITTAAALSSEYLGYHAESFGLCPGDGKLYNNNAVLLTITAAIGGYGDFYEFIPDPASATLVIKKNGTPVHDPISITANKAWEYASTVSGDPGQRAVISNPGDTPMRHAQGDLGWWAPADTIEQVMLSTEPYITAPTDAVPHLKYAGDLDRQQNPVAISDSIHAWMWGASAPSELGSGGLAQLQVNDPLLKHERLFADAARDKAVPLARGGALDTAADSEPVFFGLLDHGEPDTVYGNQVKQVYLRNKLSAQLIFALRRARFSPAADPSVAGKPRPMRLGIVRGATPELEDAATNLYAWTDQDAITAFGTGREFGVPLVYGADYHISDDGAGIVSDTDGGGRRTYEATTFGGSFDSGAPDYWSGAADFTTLTPDGNNLPTGWTISPTPDSNDGYGFQAGFRLVAGVGLKCICHAFETKQITPPGGTPLILAGRTYGFRLRATRVPQFGEHLGGGPAVTPVAILYLSYATARTNAIFSHFVALSLDHAGVGAAGEYTGVFTSPLSADATLRFVMEMNSVEAGSNAHTLNYLMITDFELNEFPAATAGVPLDGPGLDYCLQATMIKRGPVDVTEYISADAQAIDTATGYKYGIQVRSDEDPPIKDLLDGDTSAPRLLHPACAMLHNDESGLYRVTRLTKPELVADADLVFDLKGGLDNWGVIRVYEDFAENLTARLSGRRNCDPLGASDYGDTDLATVPRSEREYLAQPYLWTVTSRKQLAARYAKAYTRPPLLTFLDDPAHGQHAIDYACDFYTDARNFYVWPIFEPLGRLLLKGSIGRITDRTVPSLAAGVKVMFIGYSPRLPSEQKCTAIFWGL